MDECKPLHRGSRVVLHVKEADKTIATAGWAAGTYTRSDFSST